LVTITRTAYWHAAAAALTARRIADTPEGHLHNQTSPDRAARNQVATDLYRALSENPQSLVLNVVAIRTGAAWLNSAETLDDDALTKPAIADHLTQAMVDHGYLPADKTVRYSDGERWPRSPNSQPELVVGGGQPSKSKVRYT
jgi:hypothetical protein